MRTKTTVHCCPNCRSDALDGQVGSEHIGNFWRVLRGDRQVGSVNCPDCNHVVSFGPALLQTRKSAVAALTAVGVSLILIFTQILIGAPTEETSGARIVVALLSFASIFWLPPLAMRLTRLIDREELAREIAKSRQRVLPLSPRYAERQREIAERNKRQAKEQQTKSFLKGLSEQDGK